MVSTIKCDECGKIVERTGSRMRLCKECSIINVKKLRKNYYENNKDKEKESKKIWNENNKERIKENWQIWYEKNKKRINDKRKTPEGLKKRREGTKKYKKKYPEKVKACIMSRIIPIPKNKLCEDCKINFALEKHHKDYEKPLEVEFLCKKCHTKRHFGGN